MKSSSIRFRVADFLKQYAPFDAISEPDLLDLAMGGRVKFHECDEVLFQQGARRGPYLFVIQQGTVRLLERFGDSQALKDLLGEGDLLGIGQFLGDKSYRYTAMTASDVILYALRIDAFEGLMTRYPAVARYLTAYSSVRRARSLTKQDPSAAQPLVTEPAGVPSWVMAGLPFADALHKRLLTCSASTSIRDVAKRMREHCRDVAAVVDSSGQTKGIITTDLLRDRVATGEVPPQAGAEAIMQPMCTFAAAGKTIADYLLQLVDSRKPYLGITHDGDAAAPLIGLLSATDLTLHAGFNPVAVLREVTQAERVDELARLRSILASSAADRCTDGPTMEWYTRVMSVFDRLLLIRVVRLARAELTAAGDPFPDTAHCWLLLGTAGRTELLIRKGLDWGVVYADPLASDEALISSAFVALGQRIDAMLNACGYPRRGDHSGLCRSLSGWQERYRRWIHDPIMSQSYRSIEAFDLLPIDGDTSLAARLKQSIKAELECAESNFVPLMANDAMAQLPPLTFFHGQVVDDRGARSNRFDLRHSTLQPLVDMARVLALDEGRIGGEPTAERLERCAATHPEHQALFTEAAEAFRLALRLYALTVDTEHDDRTIDPGNLGRYEQQLFKSIFRSVLALLQYAADHFGLIPHR